MSASSSDATHLDTRGPWPDTLLDFYRRHPREAWDSLALPDLAQMWLHAHRAHLHEGELLEKALQTQQGGAMTPEQLTRTAAPVARRFIAGLHYHHQSETYAAFPALAKAAPEIAAAFEVLDRDHDLIEARLGEISSAFQPGAAPSVSLDRVLPRALRSLRRHLADEEDIVIPALIARGHLVRGI